MKIASSKKIGHKRLLYKLWILFSDNIQNESYSSGNRILKDHFLYLSDKMHIWQYFKEKFKKYQVLCKRWLIRIIFIAYSCFIDILKYMQSKIV